jgi:glycerol-3-phosphate dehydrogenase
MLGTTDTPYDGDADQVTVEDADIDQVFGEASLSLPEELLRRDRIVYSFAGLRVLELGGPTTAETPREHVITSGRLGMVSVAGGKLTTHRRIAMDVLRRLDDRRAREHRLRDVPLPGAGPMPPRPDEVEPEVWDHLRRHYGSEVSELLKYRETEPDALERVHPEGPDIWAQVHHGVRAEWATTVEDVVRRRTSLAVRGLATSQVRARIADVMGLQPSPVEPGS